MKITDITAYVVNVPLVGLEDGGTAPYVTNHNELTDMDRVIIRVDTDQSNVGWGETQVFLSPAATVSVIEDGIKPLVMGHSPFEIESFRRLLFTEYTNVESLFAPVEIACWDIVGKALNKPVYELLGGWTAPDASARKHSDHVADYETHESIEFIYCLGIHEPEMAAEKPVEARDDGYTVVKTKAGRDWQQNIRRLKAMHVAVDGDLEFRADPNQRWTLDQAIRVGAALEDAGIYLQYLEQPIRVDAHRALARFADRLRQPIGPNEDTYIQHNLRALITEGAIDVAVLDITPVGGITGLRQAAAIVEDAAIPATHHCAFDLGVRTAAILLAVHGIPGFTLPPDTVYDGWADDTITDPFTIEAGAIDVPTAPRLGIEVDMEQINAIVSPESLDACNLPKIAYRNST